MVEWLLENIGSKATELQNGYMSDEMIEMVGGDIHNYIGILKDLIMECILPF